MPTEKEHTTHHHTHHRELSLSLNSPLKALSPLDGRYHQSVHGLSDYFSEFAFMRYRLLVEVEYLIALSKARLTQLPPLPQTTQNALRQAVLHFDLNAAQRIKEIETRTNHDVKAIEYFLREVLAESKTLTTEEVDTISCFIHFGLTSQDINNTAIPLMLHDGISRELRPKLAAVLTTLEALAERTRTTPMLARTHGQPASPTTVGKEIAVFCERLHKQFLILDELPYPAKFGGATGNFNAHRAAYPNVDWVAFADKFVADVLHLQRSKTTTQIEHYDGLAAIFDCLRRINVILIDLCRDFWAYISMDYFTQKTLPNEVGSSAMPHKVNPIDFENAEGNLGLANALYDHLSNKLPISRLQRDLTDSTVLRNVGVPIGHSLLALTSLLKGLSKIEVNNATLSRDLDANAAVVAEAYQTILRREGFTDAYERLKDLTRTGSKLDPTILADFIQNLPVSDSVKEELRRITPANYIGTASGFEVRP